MHRALVLAVLLGCSQPHPQERSAPATGTVQPSTDPNPFEGHARITFPPRTSLTELSRLQFHGTSSPPVSSISIDGLLARSNDDFATWSVEVPVPFGPTRTFVADASSEDGYIGVLDQVTLGRRGPILTWVLDIAVDSDHGRTFVLESDRIVAMDTSTGTTRVVSGPFSVAPAPLDVDESASLAWDPTRDRLLLLADDQLLAVDRATGERTVWIPSMRALGLETFSLLAGVDPVGDRLLVAQHSAGIAALDLQTQAIAASVDVDLSALYDATYDDRNDTVLITAQGAEVLRVDMATGAVDSLLAAGPAAGPLPSVPMALATDGTTAWVFDGDGVVAIDLATLDRDRVGGAAQVRGARWSTYAGGFDGSSFLVGGPVVYGVASWDLQGGAPTPVSANRLGDGPGFDRLGDLDWDEGRDQLLAVDFQRLHRIDLETGDREVVGDLRAGLRQGPPTRLTVSGDTAWVAGPSGVDAFDLHTGQRQTVFAMAVRALAVPDGPSDTLYGLTNQLLVGIDTTTGAPNGFVGPGALVDLAWHDGRLIALREDHLLEVDPVTGDAHRISSEGVGNGPELADARRLRIGPDGAYVTDGSSVLTHVDLETGDRRWVTETGAGGPAFEAAAIGPDGQIVATSVELEAVLAVDPLTGDRVIFSR